MKAWAFIFFSGLTISLIGQTSIRIKLVDPLGRPVSDAALFIDSLQMHAVSNNEGLAFFEPIADGRHRVRVSHVAFEPMATMLKPTDNWQVLHLSFKVSQAPEFELSSSRVVPDAPVTHQTIGKEDLARVNLAQDMPALLNQAVSVVTTSDAGAGIGYTAMRIRGSDATRINHTINGVPLNDAESQGVFWVNLPDLASSLGSVQVQRGLGTSSSGVASFGAAIHAQTENPDTSAGASLSTTLGSFAARRHQLMLNTGAIAKGVRASGRLSYINSEGYIDRAGAELASFSAVGGYFGKRVTFRLNALGGTETTQQAWYGTPQSRLEGDSAAMVDHALNNGFTTAQRENLFTAGRTYNHYLYENEIDRYTQLHYQALLNAQIKARWWLSFTGHYTRGYGFFEQYRFSQSLSDFGLNPVVLATDTVTHTDAIVRRWLSNHFYGGLYSLTYQGDAFRLQLGGASNHYVGDHFGELLWLQQGAAREPLQPYYSSDAAKTDVAHYALAEWRHGPFTIYADLQHRFVLYASAGTDHDQQTVDIDALFHFFNPKAGFGWQLNSDHQLYLALARGHREPVRSDFTDAAAAPVPESLNNAELGWRGRSKCWNATVNAFWMEYQNQLVLTGALNDVGAALRTNVPQSRRYGLEAEATWRPFPWFRCSPNAAWSQSLLPTFDEVLYDYTNGFEQLTITHTNTSLAYSPTWVAALLAAFTKGKSEATLMAKYVDRQFLDNTANTQRSIPAFYTVDASLRHRFIQNGMERIQLSLLVNNVFNHQFSSNGYTFSYIYGATITENFFYPQAGTNWLLQGTVYF